MTDIAIAGVVACLVSVFAGALSQRATGIGLALIATPALVFTVGPVDAVTVMIICGATGALLASLGVLRQVDWRIFALTTISGALLAPLGAWLVQLLDALVVQLVLAALIVSALVVPLLARRVRLKHPSTAGALVAGGALGFVNAGAGVGGPALVAYAVASDWDFAGFRATAQPVFFAAGVYSMGSRLIVGSGLGAVDLPFVAILVAGVVGGTVVGGLIARWIPIRVARRIAVGIALAGSTVVALDALVRLLQR